MTKLFTGRNRGKPTTARLILLLLLLAMGIGAGAGCTTEYSFEFRSDKTGEAISEEPVALVSSPRGHSFIDIRHYITDSCKPVVVHGQTNKDGQVTMSLPSNVAIGWLCLNGQWFARNPSHNWQQMQTQQEFESPVDEANLKPIPGRPQIRIQRK